MRIHTNWLSLSNRSRVLKTISTALIATSGLAATQANLSANEVPIILYGQIGDADEAYWIRTDLFTEHMEALKDDGYTTVTPQDILDFRAGTKTPPEKPVLLTFTNGYRNLLETVDPLLEELDFQATAMILPAYVGGDSSWDDGDEGPIVQHATWNELRDLEDTGRWSFGSHTTTHPDLLDLTSPEIEDEVAGSRLDLEAELDNPILVFSYPYGNHNEEVRQAVRDAGYSMALGVREDVSHDDLWALPRLDPDNSVSGQALLGPEWLGAEDEDENEWQYHPSDINEDGEIGVSEVTAYGSAWRKGEAWNGENIGPGDVTRAGAIWRSGGYYDFDPDGSGASRWTALD